MTPVFIFLFFVAGTVSLLTCLVVKRIGPAVGLIDKPGFRKIHEIPTPTGGGLGVWLGVILPIAAVTVCAGSSSTGSGI